MRAGTPATCWACAPTPAGGITSRWCSRSRARWPRWRRRCCCSPAALWQAWGKREWISPMTLGLALPPLLYFVFSMTSGINIGMRHILPVYPFLYVGAAAWLTTRTNRRARLMSWPRWWPCRLASARASRPITWPSSMSWRAVPGAGPNTWSIPISTGARTSRSSALWLDAHGGKRRARLYYFGNTQVRYYGIDEIGFPGPLDQKGWDDINEYCVANVTPLEGVYVHLATSHRSACANPSPKSAGACTYTTSANPRSRRRVKLRNSSATPRQNHTSQEPRVPNRTGPIESWNSLLFRATIGTARGRRLPMLL